MADWEYSSSDDDDGYDQYNGGDNDEYYTESSGDEPVFYTDWSLFRAVAVKTHGCTTSVVAPKQCLPQSLSPRPSLGGAVLEATRSCSSRSPTVAVWWPTGASQAHLGSLPRTLPAPLTSAT